MSTKSISGFLAGVVALAGAAALGGPDLATRHWDWVVDWDDHRDGIHRDGEWRPVEKKDSKADATRELSWDGATKAVFELRADIDFTQAPGPGKVTVMGPKDLVDRVRLSEGRFSLDGAPDQLLGLSAVRQGHDHVVGLDDAQVAMERLGRMQKVRRGAGAAEGRRDLGGDDPGFAHPGDDDVTGAVVQQIQRTVE